MNDSNILSVEEVERRQKQALATCRFVLVQVSERRWAAARLMVHVGRCWIGADKHGAGKQLVDHVTADVLLGYEKLDGQTAMRVLYDLINGLDQPPR